MPVVLEVTREVEAETLLTSPPKPLSDNRGSAPVSSIRCDESFRDGSDVDLLGVTDGRDAGERDCGEERRRCAGKLRQGRPRLHRTVWRVRADLLQFQFLSKPALP